MNYSNKNLAYLQKPVLKSLLCCFALSFLPPVLAKEGDLATSKAMYTVPDVAVVNQNGKKNAFVKELDDGRPVMMNFIFASCSAICPMLSHTFAKVQSALGKNKQNVHLVSISIDPENDTPSKLSAYAKKFNAGANWDYYTGSMETSVAIQKAFEVYRGDKMNHTSVVLIRTAPGQPWSRLEGFMTSDAIMREYNQLSRP